MDPDIWPLVILGIGVATVLGLIMVMKVNAFIALISAAMLVSLLAPGALGEKISRVAAAFGATAGGIGIVIALAAVIGKCMLDSGAADRIVRAFLRLLGEKQAPVALMGSGFVLAIPVFFDTVFYLLVPLARSLHRKTGKEYLKYILAIGAGGAITHTLVPPTPGPLLMAETLGIDVGWMIMFGLVAALPAAVGGVVFATLADRLMPTPMRSIGNMPDPKPLEDSELPPLVWALAPVLLPVILISSSTILNLRADAEHAALVRADQLRDFDAWRATLVDEGESPTPGTALLQHNAISPAVRDLVGADRQLTVEEREQVIAEVNRALADKNLFAEESLTGVQLSELAASLLAARGPRMRQAVAERMNRAVLESAYPGLIEPHVWDTPLRQAADVSNIFGDANFALLLSTVIAIVMLAIQRGMTRTQLAEVAEVSLMSGGVIILITAAGGAFGAMLQAAQVGPAIENMFSQSIEETAGASTAGLSFLVLGFGIAAVLKVAQGSSTVAMIVGSAMIAAIVQDMQLAYHPVYLATSIGAGSLVGSWMNDSGFWIFAKMGGLTEAEALKSWTVMLVFLGLISFAMSLLMAAVLPLAPTA
ncbi:MAG: GntP family permease [Planctomycetes bacterium]|nr:GntP family permease [Planctomycetota bacterium]